LCAVVQVPCLLCVCIYTTADTIKAAVSTMASSIGTYSVEQLRAENERYGYLSTFMVATDTLLGALDKARERITKKQIDLAKATSDTSEGSAEFLDLFEGECDRVTRTIQSQLDSQELSAKAVLSNIGAVVKYNYSDASMKGFRAKAGELADMCLKLQRFVARNAEILTEIASRADREIGTYTMIFLHRKLAVAPWVEGPNSALVVVLSDIYEDIRKAEDMSKAKDSTWVAPSSFERSTTKYWIQPDKLTELLLAAVTEAPLLVYGRSGHLTDSAQKTEGNKLWDSLATPINSVYFDSPDMVMYAERIKRSEGAQLFRIRWYGDKPKGDEPVFLELKTHHEKWINVKSVKERVNILERDVKIFLSDDYWDEAIAAKLVRGPAPTMSGDKLQAQVTLLTQMHELVLRENLRPCVRSMYVRAAFQSPSSNALRLTLDRNVTLVDETRAPEGAWCLPDDAVISSDMITRVPYPVFEIKLSDAEMPGTFSHLIETGTLIEAPKFSKFLTGAASFNAEQLEILPYWADEPGMYIYGMAFCYVRFEGLIFV
jgi:SPX domain protein involved in polyphosphate accumulation